MRKSLLCVAVATGVAVNMLLGGCSASPAVSQRSVIIEPEAVAPELGNPRTIVLDARNLEDYGPAHALGAQRLDMRDWSTASRKGEGLNDAAGWSTRISALGIDESTPVIIYDEGGMTSAARAWFILRECGIQDVRVVNGGWTSLCPVLEPSLVQAGNPGDFAPTRFAAATPKRLVTKDELKALSGAATQPILDVRTEDEFTGNVKVDPGRRVGHVPGTTNLPHKQMLDERGRLRTPEELRAIFAANGATEEKPAVLLCQSGGRAAFAALAAEHAGLNNTTVYYMSMGEWLADPNCPVQ